MARLISLPKNTVSYRLQPRPGQIKNGKGYFLAGETMSNAVTISLVKRLHRMRVAHFPVLLSIIKNCCNKFNTLNEPPRKSKILKHPAALGSARISPPFYFLNFAFSTGATMPNDVVALGKNCQTTDSTVRYFSDGVLADGSRTRTHASTYIYAYRGPRPSVSSPECLFRTTWNMEGWL